MALDKTVGTGSKYYLGKHPGAGVSEVEIDKLKTFAGLAAAENVVDASDASSAALLANALKDIMINLGLMGADS